MIEYIIGGAAIYFGYAFSRRAYKKIIQPKLRGSSGERKSIRALRKLKKGGNELLHDLLLPTDRGATQLDHIVLTRAGIFAIETKNYSGLISGREWDKEWTQTTARNTYAIPNPVRQNYKHIKALQYVLHNFPNVPITSVIAFSDRCQLDVYSEKTLVLRQRELSWAIEQLSRDPIYTDAQVKEMKNLLLQANSTDKSSRMNHRDVVKLKGSPLPEDYIDQLFERAKDQPVLHFSPEQTLTERALQDKLNTLQNTGPLLTIKGWTNTIEGFVQAARRNADNTVAEPGAAFDHMMCPYTHKNFPPSELVNFERGLWLSYLTKNPSVTEYLSTPEGFRDVFPEFTHDASIVSEYLKNPTDFITQAKNTAWYQNIKGAQQKPKLQDQIKSAAKQNSLQAKNANTPDMERDKKPYIR